MWDENNEKYKFTIMDYSYYVGIRTHPYDHPDCGKPCLDFFVEIPPEIKLSVEGFKLIGDDNSEAFHTAKLIKQEIDVIRIRVRYNEVMTCLFHSPTKLTRNEIHNLIQTMRKERLMEARCLL